MSARHLIDFAAITIFARETLEGGIIIGEYRTVVLRSDWSSSLSANNRQQQQDALEAITVAAIGAAALALFVCAAVAIPLAILSRDFNTQTATIIEGVSKIVAAICILGLSLKIPKFFGLYGSKNQQQQHRTTGVRSSKEEDEDNGDGNSSSGNNGDSSSSSNHSLSLRSIQFNVAWNIWREVAECGVFLIPSFLTGDGIIAIPLSAVIGIMVGTVVCLGIYHANQKISNPLGLTIFTVCLLLLLSTGLFSGGCHEFEEVYGVTRLIWKLNGTFWSVNRLPMTIFKPFGYSDQRTLLQMICFWVWIVLGIILHYRKYCQCRHWGMTKTPPSKDEEVATKLSLDVPSDVLVQHHCSSIEQETGSPKVLSSDRSCILDNNHQEGEEDVENIQTV